MNTNEIQWCRAIPRELIHPNDIHVWRASLNLTTNQTENLLGILSPDESERAARFHFERDRKRFIAARGILRKILGGYMEVGPDKLRFVYSHHGKPLLDVNTNPEPLNFNLSHSGDFVLYTFTRSRNIGIDIELVRENVALEQIALRFFSPDEIISLENINKEKRPELFFQYWTRKEAFLKAKGEGVSFPMELCDVSQLNGTQLSPIKILGDNSKDSYWFGRDLIAAPGYVGAIAVEGDKVNLSCRDYSVEEM